MISAFADATGDHQWIHVDEDRARSGPFGRTIAHGYLILAMVPALLNEVLVVEEPGTRINYGLNRVRFITPVPSFAGLLHTHDSGAESNRTSFRHRGDETDPIQSVVDSRSGFL